METIRIDKQKVEIYGFESEGSHIIPPHFQPKKFSGDTILWLLPVDRSEAATMIKCGTYTVKTKKDFTEITVDGKVEKKNFSRPLCCDFFGKGFSFDIENKELFERTFSEFYWHNQLNQIAERTFMRRKKDIREGYVLSTLDVKAYGGTYPAVDHEFHMKGRFAVGGKAEAELIRRMLLLQIKVMREDRKKQFRNLCSIQPNRRREYNVWRYSQNKKVKAQMFRLTANVEFLEGFYNYICLTNDRAFLSEHFVDIEKNCAFIERFIGDDGFLDSHVYFEDQVIKNHATLQAQLFAANSFRLAAELADLLGKSQQANHYRTLSEKLGKVATATFPKGFWDEENERFIDWIDKDGKKHDHIHLLANQLPELFGFANENQIESSRKVIADNAEVFNKFPSFVAAKVEDYTPDEIGVGGPYDLCAAGRYWCWDAEYLAFRKDGEKLENQLLQVCREAEKDGFLMGERYDMNHVYYNSGEDAEKNWHGASLYYEYPNVWMYIFICKYLGIRRTPDGEIQVNPLFRNGTVTLGTYGIEVAVKDGEVSVTKI